MFKNSIKEKYGSILKIVIHIGILHVSANRMAVFLLLLFFRIIIIIIIIIVVFQDVLCVLL